MLKKYKNFQVDSAPEVAKALNKLVDAINANTNAIGLLVSEKPKKEAKPRKEAKK